MVLHDTVIYYKLCICIDYSLFEASLTSYFSVLSHEKNSRVVHWMLIESEYHSMLSRVSLESLWLMTISFVSLSLKALEDNIIRLRMWITCRVINEIRFLCFNIPFMMTTEHSIWNLISVSLLNNRGYWLVSSSSDLLMCLLIYQRHRNQETQTKQVSFEYSSSCTKCNPHEFVLLHDREFNALVSETLVIKCEVVIICLGCLLPF
jgi:hypothetical protein